jgi:hypothetical protein
MKEELFNSFMGYIKVAGMEFVLKSIPDGSEESPLEGNEDVV